MGYYHYAALAYGYECPEPDAGQFEWETAADIVEGVLPYVHVGRDYDKLIVGLEGFVFSSAVPGTETIVIPEIPEDYKERLDAELVRLGLEPPSEKPQWWFGGTAG